MTRAFSRLPRWLALVLLFSAVSSAQAPPPLRSVCAPVLNMYSSPGGDADVVSQAIFATAVTVLQDSGGWTKIQTSDNYIGWVESSALVPQPGKPYGTGTPVVHVRSLFAHVYREESVTRHAPLLTVPFETRLEVEGPGAAADRWTLVRLPDGRRGAIQNGDIASGTPSLTVEETITLAKRFLGLPYTWGGTSSFGFDCSGFTQMLMRQRGYHLPRDARVQATWTGTSAVPTSELQPGDLLYFGASAERITHTGMYIGDGQFINATTHERPMVRIDDVADPQWARLLVAARRARP